MGPISYSTPRDITSVRPIRFPHGKDSNRKQTRGLRFYAVSLCSRLRVQGCKVGVQGSSLTVQGSRLWVKSSRVRVQGYRA